MSIVRNRPNRRNRTMNSPQNQPPLATPIYIVGAAVSGTVLTLTLDQPVSLNGVPKYTTSVDGATAVSAVKTAPHVVAITFSEAIDAATAVIVEFRDSAIRNASGGFVATSTFPVGP